MRQILDNKQYLEAYSLFRFSSLVIPLACGLLPIGLYLPQFYARDLGLGLGTVGMIFMIIRLLNGLADPVVGLLSDRTETRFGARKPWIVAGASLLALSGYFLFLPPSHVSSLYLTFWLTSFMLALTMVQTPFYAWGTDLPTDYHGRSRVQSYLLSIFSAGFLVVFLLSGIVEQHHGTSFQKMRWLGIYLIASLAVALPLSFTAFGKARSHSRIEMPSITPKATIWATLRRVFGDPLVRRVMGSDFAVSFGQGVRTALFMFFIVSVMKLPQWASLLFMMQAAFGILAAPLWLKISYWLGKPRTVIAGEVTQILINLSLLAVTPDRLWLLWALIVAQGLAQSSGNLMLRAIVSDLAESHRRQTGQVYAGILASMFNVTVAAGGAIAVGITFALVGHLGFHPAGPNTPAALSALQIVFAVGPAFGHAVSVLLIWGFPRAALGDERSRLSDPISSSRFASGFRLAPAFNRTKRRVA